MCAAPSNTAKEEQMDIKKALKLIPGDEVQDYKSMPVDKLKDAVIELQKKIFALKSAMAQDQDLKEARERVKELRSEYTDTIKRHQARIQFILAEIKEKKQ